jgi:hypothetical protein
MRSPKIDGAVSPYAAPLRTTSDYGGEPRVCSLNCQLLASTYSRVISGLVHYRSVSEISGPDLGVAYRSQNTGRVSRLRSPLEVE